MYLSLCSCVSNGNKYITCSNLLTPSVKVRYPANNKRTMSKVALIVCYMSLKPRAPAVVFATADTHTHTAPAALLLQSEVQAELVSAVCMIAVLLLLADV